MPALKTFALGVCCLSVISCVPSDNYAPVADVSGYEAVPLSGTYRVAPGDTLYSIAWRYGADYLILAKKNHIGPPYDIHTGQVIYLRDKALPGSVQKTVQSEPLAATEPAPVVVERPQQVVAIPSSPKKLQLPTVASHPVFRASKEPNYKVTRWAWPAHGKILVVYSKRNKGIDIGGDVGSPIYAAAPGKVVYAGDGLRGYGNLIILKHNSQLLSAYAYNKRLVAHEGEWVVKGQIIAIMGQAPDGKPGLHFEIREAGLPVNPMNLLKK